MKNKKITIFITSFIFLFVLAPITFAAVVTAGPTTLSGVTTIVDTIITWVQTIVFLVAILMIIWAGFSWMTAGGDEEKIKTARSILLWSLVGIAVALFAGVAQTFVTSIL
ncbi:MAG: TrbC/VirB2 family protein [Candidatus Portnoybacteria bacterium]|nr:TrbC/VirB2 family protein [Candidatus Portnoybacteria bacterium]